MQMPSTHPCPCGCGQGIQRHRLACAPGWYRLPAELRQAINAAYRGRARDPGGHRRLVAEALAWYRNNARGATGG